MSRIRNVLDRIRDPSVQTAICESAYTQIRPVLKEALINCPYALNDNEADALENLGISVNPYAVQTHTHAAAKAIENQMLQIVGHHLPKSKVTFLFLKRSKLRYLRRAAALKDTFMNKEVEPKDFFRYDSDTIHSRIQEVSTSVAYMSDTLHFMTLEELAHLFESSPRLDTLLATVVLPVEALHRKTSLHPAVYSINYNKDGFEYIPGNHGGGAYFHPYNTLEWLKVRQLECAPRYKFGRPFTLTFQMVESLGANHLFIIRRGLFETPQYRTFCRNTFVLFPKIFHPASSNANRPITKTKAMQMWLYVKAVKAVTERDIYAKIHQVLPTNELELYEPDELVHLANYFFFLSNLKSYTCYEDLLSGGLIKRLTRPVRTAVTRFIEFFAGRNDFNKLMDALKWEPFTYTLEPAVYKTKVGSHVIHQTMEATGRTESAVIRDLLAAHQNPDLLQPEDLIPTEPPTFLDRTLFQGSADSTQPRADHQRDAAPTRPTTARTTEDRQAGGPEPEPELETTTTPAPTPSTLVTEAAGTTPSTSHPPQTEASTSTGMPHVTQDPNPMPQSAATDEEERHKRDPTKMCVCASGWSPEPFFDLVPGSLVTKLKTRDAFFFSTRPDITYGHDKVSYARNDWPLVLTDFLRTVGFQANGALLQIYAKGPGIPWHKDDEPCYDGQPILTLNFGQATFEFSNGVKMPLKDGEYFVMAGPWLKLKHRVTNCSSNRMSITFRTHTHTIFGHPLPGDSVNPKPEDKPRPAPGNQTPPAPASKETPPPQSTHQATDDSTSPFQANTSNRTRGQAPPHPQTAGHHDGDSNELPKKNFSHSPPWNAWIPLLNAHGFNGHEQQLNPEGFLIIPISDVKQLPHCPFPDTVPKLLQENLKRMRRFPTPITLRAKRAAAYASDVKNNRTGKLLSSMDLAWKASLAYKMQFDDLILPGIVIHGCGGSGKSQMIQSFMASPLAEENNVTVITPTVELRNDWATKVPNVTAENFKTFEKAMIQPCNSVVVFDDYTKLPPGYIEALLMHHRNVDLFILTGDSRQSVYHESNSEAYISTLSEAVEVFEPYSEFYVNATHRNVTGLANKLGVYSERQGKLRVSFSTHHLKGSRIPLLVPSNLKRNAFLDVGHRTMTYAGCQGLTAPKVQILLDNHTEMCSERVLYTALSRAVDQIHFINTGPNSSDWWAKLESTPYLKAFIDTYRDERTEALISAPREPTPPQVPAPKTHFPPAPKHLLEPLVASLTDKESRELFNENTGMSNAIQTEDPVVQLFQHQQAKDETLYWATIEARLSISTPEANVKEFALKRDVGDVLFANYAKIMHLPDQPVPFDPRMWEISAAEVKNVYLSKPVGNLVNAATRQSPDFPSDKIALFLKSQWVKKTEKLGVLKVKPGQTIASFMQETVMLYGTMARYLRKMRARYQPDNIFINCEKTPEDLNEFVKTRWNFNVQAHTNDFTAFDQSQDGAMLQFEVLKAKFFNVPADIIEGYITIKLNANIFLGTLSIMRLSGEGPTFDANTECSIAYNATRFHLDDSVAQVYAGDDMALDHKVPEKASFIRLQQKLKLTSKPLYPTQTPGDYAEFCGWSFTPDGIMKASLKMHASIELQKRINNFHESARSYALDLKYAYDMGDLLHDHLTEAEAEYHVQSVRDMHLAHQQDVLVNGAASPPTSPVHSGSQARSSFVTKLVGSAKTKARNASKRRAKVRVVDLSTNTFA
ncbi:RNA-dependent RNA polymerase [Lettuce virus X]|uniref:RNA replication protein n=1 Tax=Lettuce virus X TaxID=447171 RepID=B3CJG2_9VIRU|nr:RNA-dependent RNA polymerase [Lettuce virus X]CAN88808.1 RNA-dependent RNA polymerase [Lettuce virus X]